MTGRPGTPPSAWRNRGEGPALFVTIAVALVLLVVAVPFTFGGVLILVALGAVFAVVRVAVLVRTIRTRGRPAAGRVAAVAERCQRRLGLGEDEVEIYVVEGAQRNAFAVGLGRPYVVAVYTGLLACMDDEELAFVVGHELGHVAFRHTRLLTLAGHLGQGGGFWSAVLRRLALLWWSRAAEHSADRAGLVAVGRLEPAVAALIKVGTRYSPQEVPERVAAAIAHYERQDVGAAQRLRAVLRTHPGVESRLDHLVDFARSDLGRRALE